MDNILLIKHVGKIHIGKTNQTNITITNSGTLFTMADISLKNAIFSKRAFGLYISCHYSKISLTCNPAV